MHSISFNPIGRFFWFGWWFRYVIHVSCFTDLISQSNYTNWIAKAVDFGSYSFSTQFSNANFETHLHLHFNSILFIYFNVRFARPSIFTFHWNVRNVLMKITKILFEFNFNCLTSLICECVFVCTFSTRRETMPRMLIIHSNYLKCVVIAMIQIAPMKTTTQKKK